ncbi:MAG TPA: hypothetical protein VIJ96_18655 [Acidothermaceae bacterium]
MHYQPANGGYARQPGGIYRVHWSAEFDRCWVAIGARAEFCGGGVSDGRGSVIAATVA